MSVETSFVELCDVALDYDSERGKTRALAHINLSVERGKRVVITGPSGCGKTTTLKLVSGLLGASAGQVRVAGKPVNGPLKNVGMAFQNPNLLPWRSVLNNVLLPLEIVEPHKRVFRRHREQYVAAAHELLQAVGLEEFADRQPWQLSSGMQQRVSLCRALIHDPEILLLDEPFGALDAFTREDLWRVLQALWQVRRCTVLLVTHDLREAVYLADSVYVMSRRPGRIVAHTSIALPRIRTLEDTFLPEFTEYVHGIRRQIGEVQETNDDENRENHPTSGHAAEHSDRLGNSLPRVEN